MMRTQTFAFDVYGTLIDTEGVLLLLEEFLGDKAAGFSKLWRSKQLEYTFRRGLMNCYVDFSVCTSEALEYTCKANSSNLDKAQKDQLMEAYKMLPAFEDVADSLSALKQQGHHIFAFSNGSLKAIRGLLQHAGLTPLFDGAVSMEAISSFKPNPKGYRHFNESTKSEKENSWLVSGNSFDVIGASAYGMKTVWLQRNANTVFDPMGYEPTLTVRSLGELPFQIN